MLLKPLAAARADGDRVHAVIRSSAVGHPGRAAPGPQHGRLVGRALAAAGLRPPGTGPQHPDAGPQREARGAGPQVPDAGLKALGVGLEESSRTVAALVGDAGAVTGAAALVRAVGQLRHAVLLAGPDRPAPAAWEPARRDDGTVLPRRALVSVPGPAAPAAPAAPAGTVDEADAADGVDGTDGVDGGEGTDGGEGVGAVLVVEEAPAVPAPRPARARRRARVPRNWCCCPPPRPRTWRPPPAGSRPACPTAAAGPAARRARISPRSRTNCAWGGRCCAAVWR
ncbi:hypothetical protein HEP84_58170 [Streptomyces sp. RLB1-33]|nr:hypothetical protein [Streptomyces sp. RLB1-33]